MDWPPDQRLAPAFMVETLKRYISDGVPTGGFLYAVLSNDLKEAIGRADFENGPALAHIVAWIYSNAPANCWGSRETVAAWIQLHAERRRLTAERTHPTGSEEGETL